MTTSAHGLVLAGILFALGMGGVLARRNLLFILLSLEVMLSATGLAFVAAAARWHQADGQVMYLFGLTLSACETAVALAMALLYHRHTLGLDTHLANTMRG